jgi:NADH-quinone oxidoreductase subunit M
MTDIYCMLLSAIVFLPCVGAIVLAFMPGKWVEQIRIVTLVVTLAVLGLVGMAYMGPETVASRFQSTGEAAAYMQSVFNVSWIPSFNIDYYMGMDGISFPLVVLTAFVSVLAMGASWSITKHVKAYCILFLLLETGMIGVFLALDFFLFYVFWEVMLLPMYFLIGVWGGPRREYAAIKFFLYTLVGSVLMLVAILMLYFSSDLREVARISDVFATADGHGHELDGSLMVASDSKTPSGRLLNWDQLHINPSVEASLGITRLTGEEGPGLRLARTGGDGIDQSLAVHFRDGDQTAATYDSGAVHVELAPEATAADVVKALGENSDVAAVLVGSLPNGSTGEDRVLPREEPLTLAALDRAQPVHSFNLLALAAMGQNTTLFDGEFLGKKLQWWAFLLLFIGFAIKVPSVPVHTWLPDAHVEAPTPISMILAGVLLKMGGYGIIRICYPICPHGGYDLAWLICGIGVVSMVYGAFAALAQTDFKRLVAYSSVSHMGYVVLGLGVWSAQSYNNFNPDYWNQGIQGAMFQMIAHGISSAGMFFMVGVIYDRVHHRNLNEFGGLFGKMPVYTALSIGLFFAGLGLPGLCGFIGEVFVVLSVWNFSQAMAVISAAVVVLTAAYILWTLQRVYLGAEYRGPHEEALTPSTPRENAIAGVLFVFAILFGVFPHSLPFKLGPSVLAYMEPTIERQTSDLAQWTKFVKQPELAAAESEAEAGEVELAVREARPEREELPVDEEEQPTREADQAAVPVEEPAPVGSPDNPLASR